MKILTIVHYKGGRAVPDHDLIVVCGHLSPGSNQPLLEGLGSRPVAVEVFSSQRHAILDIHWSLNDAATGSSRRPGHQWWCRTGRLREDRIQSRLHGRVGDFAISWYFHLKRIHWLLCSLQVSESMPFMPTKMASFVATVPSIDILSAVSGALSRTALRHVRARHGATGCLFSHQADARLWYSTNDRRSEQSDQWYTRTPDLFLQIPAVTHFCSFFGVWCKPLRCALSTKRWQSWVFFNVIPLFLNQDKPPSNPSGPSVIGSGITYMFNNQHKFNIFTLYSTNK